jgi:hypothetical protein
MYRLAGPERPYWRICARVPAGNGPQSPSIFSSSSAMPSSVRLRSVTVPTCFPAIVTMPPLTTWPALTNCARRR